MGEHAPGPPLVGSRLRVRVSPPLENPLRGPCHTMTPQQSLTILPWVSISGRSSGQLKRTMWVYLP